MNNNLRYYQLSNHKNYKLIWVLYNILHEVKMKTKILTTSIINKLKEIAINNNINEDAIVTQRKFNFFKNIIRFR